MPVGICALCRERHDLIDSHLMPKSAYKSLKGRDAGRGSPVILNQSSGTAISSDVQIKQYLLCKSCEDLFSKNGERKLGMLWSTRTGFAMRENLSKLNPVTSKGHYAAYDSRHIDHLNDLLYFAVSIFWRAHMWDWGNKKNTYGKALGSKYSEMFRLFLHGEADISDAYLIISVNSNPRFDFLMTLPFSRKDYGGVIHVFYVPGLRFELLVGKTIDNALMELFRLQGRVLVNMYRFEETPMFAQLSIFANYGAEIKGKLAKQTAEIRAVL